MKRIISVSEWYFSKTSFSINGEVLANFDGIVFSEIEFKTIAFLPSALAKMANISLISSKLVVSFTEIPTKFFEG